MELKFNNAFKKASFEERSAMDRKFYEEKYLVTDYKRLLPIDRAFIKALVTKYNLPRGFLLDLGCGTGWYSNLFAELGFRVVGIDYSKAGVFRAKKTYGDKIYWVVGDALNIPFHSKQKFDVIFCCDFPPYNLIDSPEEAIEITKNFFEMLNKNGIFIFIWSSRLTGKRIKDSVIIEYNTGQVKKIFSNVGEIIGDIYTTNKPLFPLLGKQAISKFVTKLTTFGVKIHQKNVRIICGVKKNN
jgi:SAM-dependent methyltransferase